MSNVDPALESKVIELRRKILEEDYEPTTDEVKEALEYLRMRRGTAAARKKESSQSVIDLNSLFGSPSGGNQASDPGPGGSGKMFKD